MLKIILYLILSYFCGAIPFSYIITKKFKNIDIRQCGSKNPGATNVFRSVSKPLGVLTFLLDCLKGFVTVSFAFYVNNSVYFILAVAFITLLGHIFTIFLNFKGGKGVAVGCGIFFALAPLATTICFIAFVIVVAISKYVSLGSIVAAVMLPINLFLFKAENELIIFSSIMVLIVLIRHISNIKRIIAGTENKITFGKKDELK
ncbi:glycerol-3-phosphate 1-O-acyltransferase PlsY [Candidatus Ruminimicrobium bovinum]|uniref:glycerol-3-phosphate 1-O-acyltransferase PlsY n=1 Tax=Candidatus Ruminimicrobium bovinum TaxID=3242779 RepID=UPI0039B8D5B0